MNMKKQPRNISQTDIDNFKRAMNQFSEAIGTPYWLVDAHTQHREWSDATFGPREEKGPIGPLKHLKKECDEAVLMRAKYIQYLVEQDVKAKAVAKKQETKEKAAATRSRKAHLKRLGVGR